jgi:pimeloyl-ACP methyl ester carboxylesterase
MPARPSPTVVLVHGAFADASSWNGVIPRLQAADIPVVAPANPLRGIAADTAYLASVLAQIPGPVVLVGHSYGGATISTAAKGASNVHALVFVAAFAPDEGELLGRVTPTSKDSTLMPALIPRQYPSPSGGGNATELLVDPGRFHDVFAADLSEADAAVMAAGQRPIADAAFAEPNGSPAWKDLPSWAVVATADKAAGTDLVRSMAERANAMIMEVEASHVVMVSQPQAVTNVILEAVAMVREGGRAPIAVG